MDKNNKKKWGPWLSKANADVNFTYRGVSDNIENKLFGKNNFIKFNNKNQNNKNQNNKNQNNKNQNQNNKKIVNNILK